MDRLFLDANVLFSAAYREGAGVARLWDVSGVELVTSAYAVDEARRNLETEAQLDRLIALVARLVTIVDSAAPAEAFRHTGIPDKDVPILAGAVAGRCTRLITGDMRHFKRFMGTKVAGVLVLTPADYLRSNRQAH